jgi:CCR4-NOT transcription complex subunit 3
VIFDERRASKEASGESLSDEKKSEKKKVFQFFFFLDLRKIMSSNRKLQGDIDRTMKKIKDGVDDFDEILERVGSAATSNQREKFEAELKKCIKKLQRFRDKIKNWISSNDIKDKRELLQTRRVIEVRMERFRAAEKESKTKTYSRAAMEQTKVDEDVVAVKEWVATKIEELNNQVSTMEGEIELLNSKAGKNKQTTDQEDLERIIMLECLIDRHQYHVSALELIDRRVGTKKLSAGQVVEIQDGIDDYVMQNQEPDFYEDDEIYFSIGIDPDEEEEPEDPIGATLSESSLSATLQEQTTEQLELKIHGPSALKRSSADNDDTDDDNVASASSSSSSFDSVNVSTNDSSSSLSSSSSSKRNRSASAKRAEEAAAAVAAGGAKSRRQSNRDAATEATKQQQQKQKGKQQLTPPSSPGSFKKRQETIQPARQPKPSADAAADAASSSSSNNNNSNSNKKATSKGDAKRTKQQEKRASATATPAQQVPAKSYARSVKSSIQPTPSAGGSPPSQQRKVQRDLQAQQVEQQNQMAAAAAAAQQQQQQQQQLFLQQQQQQLAMEQQRLAAVAAQQQQQQQQQRLFEQQQQQLQQQQPASLADLAAASVPASDRLTLDNVQRQQHSLFGAPQPSGNAASSQQQQQQHEQPVIGRQALQMLELSYRNMTESIDSERPKQYRPKTPCMTPSYYPQEPLPIFDTASAFEKFDTDTLFFIFYFQQGTYQQFLAAKELKQQAWRYHKKYLTWFQRHEQPKEITNDHEQGTYVYFDYETGSGWCQRKKTEFRFEYAYLEEDLS